jgi:hypothetical protein
MSEINDLDNASFVWKAVTVLSTGFIGLLSYIWKKQDLKVKEIELRMASLEKTSITREEFNGANEATRRELKEEIKNVIAELHGCSRDVNASVNTINSSITQRLDNFMALWAKGKDG